VKMERTGCSETSVYKLQTPGNYPKESIQVSFSVSGCVYSISIPPCSVPLTTQSYVILPVCSLRLALTGTSTGYAEGAWAVLTDVFSEEQLCSECLQRFEGARILNWLLERTQRRQQLLCRLGNGRQNWCAAVDVRSMQ
jgi:hypothetical protein